LKRKQISEKKEKLRILRNGSEEEKEFGIWNWGTMKTDLI